MKLTSMQRSLLIMIEANPQGECDDTCRNIMDAAVGDRSVGLELESLGLIKKWKCEISGLYHGEITDLGRATLHKSMSS